LTLGNFREKIIRQSHVEIVRRKVQQVVDGVTNLNEKFDPPIDGFDRNIDEQYKGLVAAIKFSLFSTSHFLF